MKYIANSKQDSILNALYAAMVVISKHPNDAAAKVDMTSKFKSFADELDSLGVPFSIQNRVAMAGELKMNWDRYNRTVLNEIYSLA